MSKIENNLLIQKNALSLQEKKDQILPQIEIHGSQNKKKIKEISKKKDNSKNIYPRNHIRN